MAQTNPLRGLLQVALNSVLYASSAGVQSELRAAPAKTKWKLRLRGGPPVVFNSDEVFFLPVAIEISQVRNLPELAVAVSEQVLEQLGPQQELTLLLKKPRPVPRVPQVF